MQAQALDKGSCSYKTNLVKLDRESKDFAGVVAYKEAVLFAPPLHCSCTPLVSLHHELLHLRGEREREREITGCRRLCVLIINHSYTKERVRSTCPTGRTRAHGHSCAANELTVGLRKLTTVTRPSSVAEAISGYSS